MKFFVLVLIFSFVSRQEDCSTLPEAPECNDGMPCPGPIYPMGYPMPDICMPLPKVDDPCAVTTCPTVYEPEDMMCPGGLDGNQRSQIGYFIDTFRKTGYVL